MSKKADEEINKKIAEIQKLVDQCKELANKHQIEFSFDVAGHGMGGWYRPIPEGRTEDEYDYERGGYKYVWVASSHSC